MSGIAAIARKGRSNLAREALERINHRGKSRPRVVETGYGSIGEVTSNGTESGGPKRRLRPIAIDGCICNWKQLVPEAQSVHEAMFVLYEHAGPGFVSALDGPFALVLLTPDGPYAARGRFGVSPLYMGRCGDAECFASEMKALLGWAQNLREFPHGCYCDPKEGLVRYHRLRVAEPLELPPAEVANALRERLSESVAKRIEASDGEIGSWLSGGLDSSAMNCPRSA